MRTMRQGPSLAKSQGHEEEPKTVTKQQYEEKVMQHLSVQRNYETLSRMMGMKQNEIDSLTSLYDSECAKSVSLSVQLEEALGRALRAEAASAKLAQVQEQLAAAQAECAKLKYEASVATGKAQTMTERMASLQKTAEDAEFRAGSVQREAEAWRTAEATHKAEVERLKAEIRAAYADARSVMTELKATRDALYKTQGELVACETRVMDGHTRLGLKEDENARLQDSIRSLQDSLNESQSQNNALEVALATSHAQAGIMEGQLRSMARSLELSAESRALAEKKVATLMMDVVAAKDKLGEAETRNSQLSGLLADAEEQHQATIMRGLEASEGLTRLQVQLASNKATLADTRRQMHQMEEAHTDALRQARQEQLRVERMMADQANRAAEQRHKQAEFLQNIISRMERSFEALAAMQSATGRGLGELSERQERQLNSLQYRLQVWEAQWVEVEERVARMAAMLKHLTTVMAMRNVKQAQADLQDAKTLKVRVQQLEQLLASEQAAKASLTQAKVKLEASHAEALASVRAAADERVEAERLRLGSRLRLVEAEVASLKTASEAERAAALQMVEMERQTAQREVEAAKVHEQGLREEIAALKVALRSAGQHELAALSLRHAEELQEAGRQQAALQEIIQVLHNRIKATWDMHNKLLADMGVVCSHLAKMGWDIKQSEPGAASSLGEEDGNGIVLGKTAQMLRVHFSYITESVQEAVRRPKPVSPAPLPPAPVAPQHADWEGLAKEVKSTVAKILHVEESLASNCTCMLCLEVLQTPTTCVPCGHTYCKGCLDRHNGLCAECGDSKPDRTVFNGPLESICSKYEYKLSALTALQRALQQAAGEASGGGGKAK